MAESKTSSKTKKATASKTARKSVAKKTTVKRTSAKKTTAKKAAGKKTTTKPVEKKSTNSSKKTAAESTTATAPKAEEKATKTSLQTVLPEIDLQEMFEAGCHFGHKIAKWHPKIAPYIYGSEGGVHIFDLEKTSEQLKLACQRFYDLAKEGKTLLMVGTKRSAREIIKEAASEMGCFYIVSRWMGGLLTNFNQLQKSIQRMTDIEKGLESGKFDKYTKYERLQLDKEKTRLERFFVGLQQLKGKPDCVFVVDSEKEKIVVKESVSEGVELIAIADSNADPRQIDIVIPANDDASKSVKYIVNNLKTAYNAGKTARK
jgi:small subunit ribosomal protein S2